MMFSFGEHDACGIRRESAPKLNFVSPVFTAAEDRGHEAHLALSLSSFHCRLCRRKMTIMSPTIASIASDFELLDDWEDRYRYVMELGRELPALSDAERTEVNKVRGCASQVWLVTEIDPVSKVMRFRGDSDAHIVKGLVAILLTVMNGKTADEIAVVDPLAVFAGLGLKEHLTPQRSNGLASMVARIKADARAAA